MKYDLAEMSCLDLYLSQLNQEEYEGIQHKIGTPRSKPMPLLSWGMFQDNFHQNTLEAKNRADIEQVLLLAKKFNWKNDLRQAFSKNDFEALIITDKDQNIIWVNEGFTTMTGYSKAFALHKTPRFLQGKNTSETSRNRIRKKIAQDEPFKEVIINHRKDKSTYKCEVKIFPLFSEETTHYIAFEKQVV